MVGLWLAAVLLAAAASAQGPGPSGLAANFPLQRGEAVVTCHSGNRIDGQMENGLVVATLDLRDPPEGRRGIGTDRGAGSNWQARKFTGPTSTDDRWVNRNLGEVFGLALDDADPPNIYVASSSIYGYKVDELPTTPIPPYPSPPALSPYGPQGPGAVYRLEGSTGKICLVDRLYVNPASLSNPRTTPAPSLGDLAYDPVNGVLFVSNLEDGLIYSIQDDTSYCDNPNDPGAQPSALFSWPVFDFGAPQPPVDLPGMPPRGERVYGLGVHNERLYFSVWWENRKNPHPNPNQSNEIWSTGIVAPGGGLEITPVFERQLAPINPKDAANQQYSNPVTGIAFSDTADMILTERTFWANSGVEVWPASGSPPVVAHTARTIRFGSIDGVVQLLPRELFIGTFAPTAAGFGKQQNAAGGSAVACDGSVWTTGDALTLQLGTNIGIYGLQRTPAVGNVRNVKDSPVVPFVSEALPASVDRGSFFIDYDLFFGTDDKIMIGDVALYRRLDCAPKEDDDCAVAMPHNTVGWWALDEPLGPLGGTADLALGHHGFYRGAVAEGPIHVDGTKRFPDGTAFVEVPDPTDGSLDFAAGESFSIDLWLKGTTGGTLVWKHLCPPGLLPFFNCIAAVFGSDDADGYGLRLEGNQLVLYLAAPFTGLVTSAAAAQLVDDQWHHVAVTADRSGTNEVRFYVDGALLSTATGSTVDLENPEPFRIGNSPSGANFPGSLDEVQVIDRVLLPSEVEDIADAGEWGKQKNGRTPACGAGFDLVSVGEYGNADDDLDCSFAPDTQTETCGAVAKPYEIGRCEVTNAQYADFLNAVDENGANPNGLYNATGVGGDPPNDIVLDPSAATGRKYAVNAGAENLPVGYVDFEDTARFANWLHNAAPRDGSGTEAGAYDMTGAPVTRGGAARVVVPSEDEWYKAAYYDAATPAATPSYDLFPLEAAAIVCEPSPGGALSANCAEGSRTDVGSYAAAASSWGTLDQAGNVAEWTDTPFGTGLRRIRGGSFEPGAGSDDFCFDQSTLTQNSCPTNLAIPTSQDATTSVGFRIAKKTSCVDNVDNDGDGDIDHTDFNPGMSDAGCLNASDSSETPGDLNRDNALDELDLAGLVRAFGTSAGDREFTYAGDFDGDGSLTLVDYQAWLAVVTGGAPAPGGGGSEIRIEPADAVIPRGGFVVLRVLANFADGVAGWGVDIDVSSSSVVRSTCRLHVDDFSFTLVDRFVGGGGEDGGGGVSYPVGTSGNDLLLGTIVFEGRELGTTQVTAGETPGDLSEGVVLASGGFDTVTYVPATVTVSDTPEGWGFTGTAIGGTIDFTVNGVSVQVTTTAGETAAQVAVNVAAAVNGNADLAAVGIEATAQLAFVSFVGAITNFQLNDAGLSHQATPPIPATRPGALWVLSLMLLAAGQGWLVRRSRWAS